MVRRLERKLSHRLWPELNRLYGNVCHWCGQTMTNPRGRSDDPRKMTIEHLVPLGAGGTNDLDNLRLSCRACNNERNRQAQIAAKTPLATAPDNSPEE